jgi:toxin-antitoxin system PIN domain toxin
MKPYLLDTNVLIALAWPNHVHHGEAQTWFQKSGAARFRTCPTTQTGFVRLSSNPAFSPQAVSPGEALALLDRVKRLPGHDFWPDDIQLCDALAGKLLTGHRQVTDAYLLALATAHGGVLASLDRGVAVLGRRNPGAVEIIGGVSR